MNKWLFLAFLSFYLLTASCRIDSGDGEAMYQVTDSMLNGRGFVISDTAPTQDFLGSRGERIPREVLGGSGYGAYGVDGRYYAKYGPGQSFAAIPFYLIGRLAYWIRPGWSEAFWTRTSVVLLNAVVTALTVVLVIETAQLFFDRSTSLAVAVLFGLATPAWPYAKSFFSEPLLGATMLLSGYAAMRARREVNTRWWLMSGAALGAAALVKLTALIIVPAVVSYLSAVRRPFKWLAWLGPLAFAIALEALYNVVRFGNPLTSGYSSLLRWDTPVWVGIYGLLLGPGKGLIWFTPLIALSIVALPTFLRRSQTKAEGWLIVGATGLFIGLHSVYDSWAGGGSWGPRLIIPTVAWLILPVGLILERRLRSRWQELGLAIMIAASVMVQVLGISVSYARHLQAVYDASQSSEEYFDRTQFSWPDSPITGQVRELRAVTSNLRRADSRQQLRAMVERTLSAPLPRDPSYDARTEAVGLLAFNVPDVWFVYGWLMGVPPLQMGILVALLIAVLIVSFWRLGAALELYRPSPAR